MTHGTVLYYNAREEQIAGRWREMELGEGLPPVLASPSELREVFVNLLRNAVVAVEG